MAGRTIPFTKIHGVGNDFLIVPGEALQGAAPGALSARMCERHTGVGADGLVMVGPGAAGCNATFRIYNSDGSEAGLSGNGLRCAGAWVVRDLGLKSQNSEQKEAKIVFDTKVGRRELFFLGRDGCKWIFRTEVGKPSFAAKDVPFAPPRGSEVREPIVDFPMPVGDAVVRATILSMGNPQCNVLVDDWATVNWTGLGAEMERHPYFPERANIGFVKIIDKGRIEARFWERGAGHTLASGTGSCAAAITAHLAGRCGRRVCVALERGELVVNWRDDEVVELTGPAEIVADGTYLLE